MVLVIYIPPPKSRRPRQDNDDNNKPCIDELQRAAIAAHITRAKLLVMRHLNQRESVWESRNPRGEEETWRTKLMEGVDRNFLT